MTQRLRVILGFGAGFVLIGPVAVYVWGVDAVIVLVPLALMALLYLIEYPASSQTAEELRLARGRCPQCNYDLRGSAGNDHCPECGHLIPESIRDRYSKGWF